MLVSVQQKWRANLGKSRNYFAIIQGCMLLNLSLSLSLSSLKLSISEKKNSRELGGRTRTERDAPHSAT